MRIGVRRPETLRLNEPGNRRYRRRLLHFQLAQLARRYSDVLRGSELILSFMSIAELRMGAIAAGWGSRRRLLLERFIQGFELAYADNELCTIWRAFAPTREPLGGR